MKLSEEQKSYLRKEAILAFQVIDTCLRCFYAGETHMYRPIAGQLRLLLCDTTRKKDNSLLNRVLKNFSIGSLLPIAEFEFGNAPPGYEWANSLRINSPKDHIYKIIAMPFFITKYANGLEVADLVLSNEPGTLPLPEWLDQTILVDPIELSVREGIRTVADKGGGAHLDTSKGEVLSGLKGFGIGKAAFDVLSIIAIARLVQKIGIFYQQHGKRNNFKGDINEIVKDLDYECPTYKNRAQVDSSLLEQKRNEYFYSLIRRIQ